MAAVLGEATGCRCGPRVSTAAPGALLRLSFLTVGRGRVCSPASVASPSRVKFEGCISEIHFKCGFFWKKKTAFHMLFKDQTVRKLL